MILTKLALSEINQYLANIASEEKNIQVNQNTLKVISEKADGSLRDALSIFDKVNAYCNTTWSHEEVLKIFIYIRCFICHRNDSTYN